MKKTKQQVVLHPIMFALYPIAFLYGGNMTVFDFSITFGPALTSIAVAGLIWFLLSKLLSDWNRAAVITSALLMGVFSYGSLQRFLNAAASDGGTSAPVWIQLVTGCFVAVILCVVVVLKWSKHLGQANYILNVVSIFLVVGPLFQAGLWGLGAASQRTLLPDRAEFNQNPLEAATPSDGPDIYYFVLDGYGRGDMLAAEFGFDNSAFLSGLADRGFAVADQAIANYPATIMSVSSTLNFTYLDEVIGGELADSTDRRFLRELMQDSRATRLLRSAGYNIVTFDGEYEEARIGGTDIQLKEWWFLNSFNIGVLQMTPLPAMLEAFDIPAIYELHRIRTEYPFDHMRDVAALPGPMFVYTHLYFAHPPFVFGPNGEGRSTAWDYTWDDGSKLMEEHSLGRQSYIEGYRDQVSYLNGRVLETIDTILANSKQDPIIIMHGDHGPGSRYSLDSLENTNVGERYSIFYAAHLPDGGNEDVYETMSPVNGFRIVFNRYFGTAYPLLEDQAFFSPFLQPYDYTLIEDFPRGSGTRELSVSAEEAALPRKTNTTAEPPNGD